ncbi:GNAT family N-acetyltransferase [Paractinoplanes maris]|uniref:GNAT family N-acetyltransferase n=1 Tax=Paractinoplanes maris TaxID=1734446 RepID=UPI00202085C6|nr:GNAT family N-acetyltransferase [Actinoplanes maris]
MVTWRHVVPEDFALLARWLAAPHVARWWNHETSAEAVERDFGPSARREEPNEDLLALLDGAPFGLLQRSFLHDYPEYLDELTPIVTVPPRAMTIDYLIGDATATGRGLGTVMIRSALEHLWAEHADAACVIVAVHAGNIASWRALERAGLTRVAEGELEPDNPVDDRRHVIYRLDRPGPELPGSGGDPD